jgi:esterase/lipase superfamily enzyme
MQRLYWKDWSRHLGRPMEALVYGHSGAPVLVFPTSRGRFFQWEDFRMIEALRHPLEQGWLQLFCVDGIDNETWYNFERPVSQVLEQHERYEQYLLEEFLPRLRSHNPTPFLITTGTSFGAFHAANLAARHPSQVNRVVAMSGDFDVSKNLDESYAPPAYFFNPIAYLGGVQPGPYLDELRQVEFRLAVGAQDFCLPPSQRLASLLHQLQVPHRLDVWDAVYIHDWPTWRVMVSHLL